MLEGKQGNSSYIYEGINRIAGFAPVEGLDWYLGLTAPEEEVLAGLAKVQSYISIISVTFLLIGAIIAYLVAFGISKPIVRASKLLSITA